MSLVQFIARRSLLANHSDGITVTLELEVEDATPSVRDVKGIARSDGGAFETSYERQDVQWSITFAPVCGEALLQLREFADSTESGEVFRVWLYGTEAAPLLLKRTGDVHSEDPFAQPGARDLDSIRITLEAIAAVTSDGSVDDSETIDVFDPGAGGAGSLDPPPGPPPGDFAIVGDSFGLFTGMLKAGEGSSPYVGALLYGAVFGVYEVVRVYDYNNPSGSPMTSFFILLGGSPPDDAFTSITNVDTSEVYLGADADTITAFGTTKAWSWYNRPTGIGVGTTHTFHYA